VSQSPEPRNVAVDVLFERAKSGDQEAWRQLFDACYPKVIRVIRRKLHSPQIRSLYDSTDFANDVLKSLAENASRLNFPTMDSLMAFLVRVAEHKLADEHRRHSAQKRDRGREEFMSVDLPSGEPTPSAIAVGHERWELLMARVDDDERQVIELRREGYRNEEIAERLNWHIRKVQRFLKELDPSSPSVGA
jgi:RNA polymerase sigma factor (sigma-70 family)